MIAVPYLWLQKYSMQALTGIKTCICGVNEFLDMCVRYAY